ncbi:MAG: circadian clock KaiB family protein [Chloroflexota bacterium]
MVNTTAIPEETRPMSSPPVVLKLYIAGNSTRAERAIRQIDEIQARWTETQIEVAIVDVLADPAAAEAARIIATPTLVREKPVPERRIIGDLSDLNTVLRVLNIRLSADAD